MKKINKLDEMQEQKLLKIEHNGCWLAFWGLLISLFVQLFFYGPGDFKTLAGEWIVFMILALYIVIACLKNNIWDRRLSATPETNLKISLISGFVLGIAFTIISYRNYHKLLGSVATGIFMLILTFAGCFIALSAAAVIYHKRVEHIENEETSENEKE